MNDQSALSSVKAEFTAAAVVLTSAAAAVSAILQLMPIDSVVRLPLEIAGQARFIANILCLAIVVGIATATYASYRKDRQRTVYLSYGVFGIGVASLLVLLVASDNWVVHDPDCKDPVLATQLLSRIEPPTLAATSAARNLRDTYPRRAVRLLCDDRFGEQISAEFRDNSGWRRIVLTASAVLAATGLFAGLTLLSWSLLALRTVDATGRRTTRRQSQR